MLSHAPIHFTTTTSCGQRRRQAPTPCGQQSPRNISFSKQSCCCTALCGVSCASKNGSAEHQYGELHMIRLGRWNPGAGARAESLDMGNQACRGIAGHRDDPPSARKRLVNQCAVEIQASRCRAGMRLEETRIHRLRRPIGIRRPGHCMSRRLADLEGLYRHSFPRCIRMRRSERSSAWPPRRGPLTVRCAPGLEGGGRCAAPSLPGTLWQLGSRTPACLQNETAVSEIAELARKTLKNNRRRIVA